MTFYTVTATARLAQSSPSVSLEKGAYRLRAPQVRNVAVSDKSRRQHDAANSYHAAPVAYSKQMALLIVFLILATIASFSTAYYLFTTRWAVLALPSAAVPDATSDISPSVPPISPAVSQAGPQVVHFDAPSELSSPGTNGHNHSRDRGRLLGPWRMMGGSAKIYHAEEKYLAYLPHSGFHNQRIAFENALVLSRLLNRTLLVPPVRLGNRPLPYKLYEELSVLLANSTKDDLRHCITTEEEKEEDQEVSAECLDYYEYTHVPWDWLVDLGPIKAEQKLIQRWNLTDAWLRHELHILPDDVFALHDVDRNHYGFHDFVYSNKNTKNPMMARKYAQTIHISVLASRPERLIQLGTLFGSSRLHLRDRGHHSVRGVIRRSMAFTNPHLVRAAEAIRVALGGTFLAAHVRIADGSFEARAQENVRLIWWKLLTSVLGFESDDALELEYELEDMLEYDDPEQTHEQESESDGSDSEPALDIPYIAVDKPALRAPHPDLPPLPQIHPQLSSLLTCPRKLHTAPHLLQFNIPLFIATDLPSSSSPLHISPLLSRLTRSFPCTFFLSDFPVETRPLQDLVNGRDDVPLGRFLMPFLDAMVAGRAWGVVGTERSTFSAFVTDVLWRTYHGWEIVQRG